MGFPVGYTELLLPKLFIQTLFLLSFLRSLILCLLRVLGLSHFLDDPTHLYPNPTRLGYPPVSAVLTREFLTVTEFKPGDSPDNCAVCLYEFEEGEVIRWLPNCKHIFHRSCLDRWMDHDQRTCPLCRTAFVPHALKAEFDQRLWAVSGVHDGFTGYGSISAI